MMLPELFPLHVRGIGTGVSTLMLHVGTLIVSLTYPMLMEAIGISYLFLIYAAIGIMAFLFVRFKVTETKGKSLEEIEQDLRDKNGQGGQAENSKRSEHKKGAQSMRTFLIAHFPTEPKLMILKEILYLKSASVNISSQCPFTLFQ